MHPSTEVTALRALPTVSILEHALLDAIATELSADRAASLLPRLLAAAPALDGMDPAELRALLRDDLAPVLRFEVGLEAASAILTTTEALLAPLQRDLLLCHRPAFRAPYILVSDAPNDLEGIIDVRRVETALEALLEADAVPDATIVVDMRECARCLVTLALAAIDLPLRTQIVIVAASAAERARFEELSARPATFVDRFLPLDLGGRRVSALRRAA